MEPEPPVFDMKKYFSVTWTTNPTAGLRKAYFEKFPHLK